MVGLIGDISHSFLVFAVLIIATIGYVLIRARAVSLVGGDARALHSLPGYYGSTAVMLIAVPSLLVMVAWLLVQPLLIQNTIIQLIPDQVVGADFSTDLVMSDVRRIAFGIDTAVATGTLSQEAANALDLDAVDLRSLLGEVGVVLGSDIQAPVLSAAQSYRALNATAHVWMTGLVSALALAGLAVAWVITRADFRARNTVEIGIRVLLIIAASIAILTTLGIVLSMLFEAANFFRLHDWRDFFFGLSWAPNFRGNSALSIVPLLWGTLYISLVALLVAVPIGLFAAIYLSEYASPQLRSVAKPLLEVLAGIPTIVYGLFALLTVGPFLVNVFGRGDAGVLGVEWMSGATAVLTAGLVMGIMLIPFVSSLSDDIINAVPQSLRDGSFGLGATHSETVRQVVLPAALPGIVGAILLAASRAIGETMIVVLGAGAIARISPNPFEAMTTITTRIVSQLTGDTDFASAETLVAFALGLTLFTLTLCLNILALYIVRKYREQYE